MGSKGILAAHEFLIGGRNMKRRGREYNRIRMDSGQHRRIFLTAVVLGVLAFVPVGFRLHELMITDYHYYSNLALRNQTRTTPVTANRGTIYDRNMNVMAASVTVENVYLDPHELKQSKANLDDISRKLAEILDLDAEWIKTQAKDLRKRYKQIAARVEEKTAAQLRSYINENNIRGIHLEPNARRSYPYGSLAAQVIGFTNASNTGSEGIEAAYNSFLEGSAGKVITTKGNNEMDMPFSFEKYVQSIPGCDVILTIDTTVQACLEKQMRVAIDRYQVQNGAFGPLAGKLPFFIHLSGSRRRSGDRCSHGCCSHGRHDRGDGCRSRPRPRPASRSDRPPQRHLRCRKRPHRAAHRWWPAPSGRRRRCRRRSAHLSAGPPAPPPGHRGHDRRWTPPRWPSPCPPPHRRP